MVVCLVAELSLLNQAVENLLDLRYGFAESLNECCFLTRPDEMRGCLT